MSYKYFRDSEVACKHCNVNNMDSIFMAKIDGLRELIGYPLIINSGYRCEEHNKNENSTSTNHVRGLAVDIRTRKGQEKYKLVALAMKLEFMGIGVHQGFIHLDNNRATKVMWVY